MKTVWQTNYIRPARICLYPTFKEWKLDYVIDNDLIIYVYILPLRNENQNIMHVLPVLQALRLYPTFKEWKPHLTDAQRDSAGFISYL